jgi:redox-sensitive bicupin YhaK (pirin superfamily)
MVGDGFRVHSIFPGNEIGKYRMSPFFLMDYNSLIDFSPTETPRGVGVHPHRGFETVTIVYKGTIAHHDSAGNSGVIHDGEVQWMTAGSGLLHKEYHEENFSKNGGPFHMVQLWVNLPAKYKMTPPKYQELTAANIITYPLPGDGGHIEVLAGSYENVKGPAETFSSMNVYNIYGKKNIPVTISTNEKYNTGLLVISGEILLNNENVAGSDQFVVFKNVGELVTITPKEDAIVLMLSGEPIDEPHAQ